MERLNGLLAFARTAEFGSFIAAGRTLGILHVSEKFKRDKNHEGNQPEFVGTHKLRAH